VDIIEFEHPVARDLLTRLRNKNTDASSFRLYSQRLASLLAMEATRDIATGPVQIDTPLEATLGEMVQKPPILVSFMRGGIPLIDAFLELLPDSAVGFVAPLEARRQGKWCYSSIPSVENAEVILLVPVLSTGEDAEEVVEHLFDSDARSIVLVCLVASPEGIARLKRFEDLVIITASMDRELDEDEQVKPGLGDFSKRLYVSPENGRA
jgi:uracil phosphoribosyltransferase